MHRVKKTEKSQPKNWIKVSVLNGARSKCMHVYCILCKCWHEIQMMNVWTTQRNIVPAACKFKMRKFHCARAVCVCVLSPENDSHWHIKTDKSAHAYAFSVNVSMCIWIELQKKARHTHTLAPHQQNQN